MHTSTFNSTRTLIRLFLLLGDPEKVSLHAVFEEVMFNVGGSRAAPTQASAALAEAQTRGGTY